MPWTPLQKSLDIVAAWGDAIYIPSKEGFAQDDLLAMVLYGSALLPLANILRIKFPNLLQPWYADDAAV